jgi:hypothetical protein
MSNLLRLSAYLFLCVSLNSFGALYDRGNGLIYDDVLNITWLQDANFAQTSGYDSDGKMNWGDANAWAAQLEYGGYDNWRLPSANLMNPTSPCYHPDGRCDKGYNNTTGELGHMFYYNLGNLGYRDASNNFQPDNGLTNISFTDGNSGASVSFLNLYNSVYRYSEEYAPDTGEAWNFFTTTGSQTPHHKNLNYYSWAVRDGDVSSVPLPAGIYLFLSGLVGLGVLKNKKSKLN